MGRDELEGSAQAKGEVMESARHSAKALGHPRVEIGSRRLAKRDWGARRALELFFLLMGHPEGLTREQILEHLFPECDQVSGDGLFHSTLYRCRQAVGKDTILWDDDIYQIADLGSWGYDVAQFETLVKRAGETTEENVARELHESAIRLYDGDYLEGLVSEWCEATRLRLRHLYTRSVLFLAHSYAELDLHEKALELFRLAIAKDYYLEAAHKGAVDSLLTLGDRLAAMRHYLDLVERLKRDVPSEERQQIPGLVEEILGMSLGDLISARGSVRYSGSDPGGRSSSRRGEQVVDSPTARAMD